MLKVIAQTIQAPGHIYPFLSVLLELRRRGFEVQLSVHTDGDATPYEIAGVPVLPIHWQEPKRVPTEMGRYAAEKVWLENLVRAGKPLSQAFETLLVEQRPHFVLIDPMLWGAMAAAEASGLPWASLSHNPLSIRGLGLDVRGPGMRPPRSVMGRIAHRLTALTLRMSMRRSLEIVNRLRESLGLTALADFNDRYLTAPLIIAATAEPFEYPRSDWPSTMVFVGPLLWEPPADRPAWLDALDGRPLLLLSGSTIPEYGTDGRWVQKVFAALADEPVQIVATLPTEALPDVVPANVVVAGFIPHTYLLERATCVICHGGFGVTAKALAAGVPVIAVPMALDRFEVARRVAEAEAGVMLLEHELTPERVKAAFRRATARKKGAERIAQAFGSAGGAGAAADAIQLLIAAGQREPMPQPIIS